MIIVKIGGVVATDASLLAALLKDLISVKNAVLVHGGGKEVTAVGERLGHKAEFRDGIRVTTAPEMDVVDMVLGGKINIDLVRRAQAAGLNAVGLGGQDGRLFTGEGRAFADKTESRTGQITKTDPQLLALLLANGYFPIVNSTSMDAQGCGLNINADEAAQELAMAAKAEALIFISDIAGVLKNGAVISRLDQAAMDEEIAAGVIGGGMVPKVRSARQAVEAGVGKVVIGGYAPGALSKLLSGQSGTTIF